MYKLRYNFYRDNCTTYINRMTKKEKISEVLVIAGLAAFAYYKYSKMSQLEKEKIHDDLREIGKNVMTELVPQQLKGLLGKQL